MFKHIMLGFLFLLTFQKVECEFIDEFCWAGNVIPYTIDQYFSEDQVKEIQKHMDILHHRTCLRFMKLDKAPRNNSHFVEIQRGCTQECSTATQKISPTNTLSRYKIYLFLSDECLQKNFTMMHLVHMLGFPPEHQRPDRFCYVELTRNVSENDPLYIIRQIPNWLLQYPYDKHSVTHFTEEEYLKPKLQAHELVPVPFGLPGRTLSTLDIFKIRYKYCGAPHFCRLYPDACALAKLRREGKCDAHFTYHLQ